MEHRFVPIATAMLAVSLLLPISAQTPEPEVLGMVITQDRFTSYWTAEIDGRLVPSGTTLFSPASVAATDERLAIHLTGGRLFHLEAGSRVQVRRLGFGAIRLEVEAGVVTYRDEQDKVRNAREGDKVVVLVDQESGSTAN